MYDLVIKNGKVVTAVATYQADVAIQGEKIAALGPDLDGERVLDATNQYVIPGAVDIHVHMQLALPNGYTSSDTFYSGTRAAAFGGTTTIIDFVDPRPEETLLDALKARRAVADPQVVIDYGLHMTLGPAEIGKLDQVTAVYEAGCATFKLYMAYGYRLSDGELLLALSAIRDAGGLPVVHAENWDVICALVAQNLTAGQIAPAWHPRSRPALLEGEAVGRVIDIASYVGVPLHIFHVSCAAAAERIMLARKRGLPVTGETCPQYLLLTDDAYNAPGVQGALPICAPPLRTVADQAALWRALANDELQIVATDHCPFTLADKERGWTQDFSQVPGGVPSIEMRLPALFSAGVRPGRISLNRWVDLCCTAPARLAGLAHKGDIAVGYDADLVVFDPAREVMVATDVLHEAVDWTPYNGLSVHGWPVMTVSRGDVIVAEGVSKAEAGRGAFVARRLA